MSLFSLGLLAAYFAGGVQFMMNQEGWDAADAFYATYAVEGPRAGARAGPRARRAGAGPGAGMTGIKKNL